MAMPDNDNNIDRPVHSLMFSFHDLRGHPLRRLPSTVLCSIISAAYHDGRHGRTMTACDAGRLIVKAPAKRGIASIKICQNVQMQYNTRKFHAGTKCSVSQAHDKTTQCRHSVLHWQFGLLKGQTTLKYNFLL